MSKRIDKRGKVFGRLTVIALDKPNKFGGTVWECVCECGNKTTANNSDLVSGRKRSCGCLKRELSSARNKLLSGDKSPSWGKVREASSQWKGGKRKTADGYIAVLMHDHPRAQQNGYVYEHILVMEKMLGRPVEHSEIIHHCNGNRTDNRPYNLRLFASHSEHCKHHALLRKVAKEVARGLL